MEENLGGMMKKKGTGEITYHLKKKTIHQILLKNYEKNISVELTFENEVDVDYLREIKVENDIGEKVTLRPCGIEYEFETYFFKNDWKEQDSKTVLYFYYENDPLKLLEKLNKSPTLWDIFKKWLNPETLLKEKLEIQHT
jgi:hypothetical protein